MLKRMLGKKVSIRVANCANNGDPRTYRGVLVEVGEDFCILQLMEYANAERILISLKYIIMVEEVSNI
ncbi:MAG TPA: hypothetical protein GXX71_01230 [Acholeplasma sp.]|jgi:hypothetical protein|nr:hypothetical protein [Acholeplasmatales bacterium]HHV33303.1 hypothetical protein [Acholeplasma sp.]